MEIVYFGLKTPDLFGNYEEKKAYNNDPDLLRRLADAEAKIKRIETGNTCQKEPPPWSCEHANEVPCSCPCDPNCYCKTGSCVNR